MTFSSEIKKVDINNKCIDLETDCCNEVDKSFRCTTCDQCFRSRSSLYHHSYEHSDGKNFKCNLVGCGRMFKNPKRLSEHKQRTHSDSNFLCETCGYTTRFLHNLRTHARTHTPSDKPYCCEICGILFTSLSQLKEHLKVHKVESVATLSHPFRCVECSVVFSSSKSFYHHKKLHLPTKSYVCAMCGAAYSQAAGISQHYRWHRTQNKKPFASKITIETIE